MARKKKQKPCEEMAPWLITFSDVMTLMLTFFVLLVSMSKVDERRKLVVLGSIIGAFGWDKSYDPMTVKDTKRTVEPGMFEDEEDLAVLKPMLWDDAEADIDFQSNRFVQILSINTEILFEAGQTELSPRGQALLTRMLPVLTNLEYPLLIAGHTATVRDELGTNFKSGDNERVPDLTWRISMRRALAVYLFLIDNGVSPDKIEFEAFGKYRPHYNPNDADVRWRNRRVDLVLDKRNSLVTRDTADRIIREAEPETRDDTYEVDGFRFELENPRQEP